MFDFLAEIVLGVLVVALEFIGDIVFEGVVEVMTKIPIAIWNALQTMWQDFWR